MVYKPYVYDNKVLTNKPFINILGPDFPTALRGRNGEKKMVDILHSKQEKMAKKRLSVQGHL